MVKKDLETLVDSIAKTYGITRQAMSVGIKKNKTYLTELLSRTGNHDVPDIVAYTLRLTYPMATESRGSIASEPDELYKKKYIDLLERTLEEKERRIQELEKGSTNDERKKASA